MVLFRTLPAKGSRLVRALEKIIQGPPTVTGHLLVELPQSWISSRQLSEILSMQMATLSLGVKYLKVASAFVLSFIQTASDDAPNRFAPFTLHYDWKNGTDDCKVFNMSDTILNPYKVLHGLASLGVWIIHVVFRVQLTRWRLRVCQTLVRLHTNCPRWVTLPMESNTSLVPTDT